MSVLASRATEHPADASEADDLAREVYGILGIPIDALDRTSVLQRIAIAVEARRPFLLSTLNVNFLTTSLGDPTFREALLQSDLCVADGMPIVWLSRFLTVPIKERVSGSDLFEALRSHGSPSGPLNTYLFGGAVGVAEKVCGILNSQPTGIRCLGWQCPGFGTVEEMSGPETIDEINDSGADLLAVFLSAKKAQTWLLHNHGRIRVPVRAQFGATINYQAGTVRRAPAIFQKLGFEWLWRIKEEPYLWRRYLRDGLFLFYLATFRVLPIAVGLWWHRSHKSVGGIASRQDQSSIMISLAGHATRAHTAEAIACFRGVLNENRNVVIDVSRTITIDPRFFGLLLMVRKQLRNSGRNLTFTGSSKRLTRQFHLNGFGFLLDPVSEQESYLAKASLVKH